MTKPKHRHTIILAEANPRSKDKEGSVFIYDEDVGVWFLKTAYDTLDMDDPTTDLGPVPYLCDDQLYMFGVWKEHNERPEER